MKRILAISVWSLMLAVALAGCSKTSEELEAELEETRKQEELERTKGQRDAQGRLDACYVVERDGCQYLIFSKWQTSKQGYGYLTHKGDCNNPIHKTK